VSSTHVTTKKKHYPKPDVAEKKIFRIFFHLSIGSDSFRSSLFAHLAHSLGSFRWGQDFAPFYIEKRVVWPPFNVPVQGSNYNISLHLCTEKGVILHITSLHPVTIPLTVP
jgi:hypothetical protein